MVFCPTHCETRTIMHGSDPPLLSNTSTSFIAVPNIFEYIRDNSCYKHALVHDNVTEFVLRFGFIQLHHFQIAR